jgi:hypothetical protein
MMALSPKKPAGLLRIAEDAMKFSKVLFLTVGLFSSPLTAEENNIITPNQLLELSAQALRAGEPQIAAQGADALLARNPADVNALILRAEAAILMRDFPTAVSNAQAGFFAADNAQTSFATARLAALAYAEQQKDTRSQIWLRLASQYAPDEQAARAIAEDYRFLRDRNPWSTSLRFGITPSSNINNGSASATSRLFGLPFEFDLSGDARALSGLEYSGGFTTTYRLSASNTSATFLELDANARTYTLSSEAQEQAPDADGSDYADSSVSLGLTHRFIGRPGDQPTTLTFNIGQTWYGGDPNTRFAQLSGSHAWTISPSDQFRFSITMRRTEGLNDQDPERSYAIGTGWTHAFAAGDQLTLNYTYAQNSSETADSDYTSNKIGINHSVAEPLFGINFGFGLDYETREFDASRFEPGPRSDQTITARLRAVMSDIEYFGFQPVINVEATRTTSNIDLFDRDYFSVGFDLQSSF